MKRIKGYETLASALEEGYRQSAEGKGRQRHANGKPFDRQPILEVGRIVGIGFNAGQVMKKAGEAAQMAQRGEREAAIHEFQGVLVYAASCIVLLREQKP